MATVLQFRRPEEGLRKPRAESSSRRSAEITIFPGVKIERHGQHLNDRTHLLQDRLRDPTGETA